MKRKPALIFILLLYYNFHLHYFQSGEEKYLFLFCIIKYVNFILFFLLLKKNNDEKQVNKNSNKHFSLSLSLSLSFSLSLSPCRPSSLSLLFLSLVKSTKQQTQSVREECEEVGGVREEESERRRRRREEEEGGGHRPWRDMTTR